MKIFVCNRSNELESTDPIIQELKKESENQIILIQEIKHSPDWKEKVEHKFIEVDFILFLIGKNTFMSENIKWELNKAQELNKKIIFLKFEDNSKYNSNYYQDDYVFDNVKECVKYLKSAFTNYQKLLLEQYKIMILSTEKVTEQRSKVNSIFFTITSSILSISFIFGKNFDFSPIATAGMLLFFAMALVVSYFWEILINSYGKLNKGKFIVINKIENELGTNMFQEEWTILTDKIDYKPNSETEINIIKTFRIIIYVFVTCGSIYLIIKIF